MSSSIFFNGRLISVPGSYTEVDASGLEQVGLGAAGIVAVLGTAVGGKPVSAITEPKDILRARKPETIRDLFRSGDLREVGDMLFAPSNDTAIPGGAVEVLAMKVNPATQSTGALANVSGNAVDLASLDYGAFTEQTNVQVATGTTQGKLLTIQFEDILETGDDVGGDSLATLLYTPGTDGWATMSMDITTAGLVQSTGTRAELGQDDLITAQIASGQAVQVVSSAVGDTTQSVTVYGLAVGGAPQTEVLALNGTTPVVGTSLWSAVYGVQLSAAAVGTVTVVDATTPANIIFDVPPATLIEGLVLGVGMFVANTTVSLVADAATTAAVQVWGKNAAGQTVGEAFTMNGTTPVVGSQAWTEITAIVLGGLEVARTMTMTGIAVAPAVVTFDTLQKVADHYNARKASGGEGFTFTLTTGNTLLNVDNLDAQSAVDILDPASASLTADLYAIVAWINANSQLISAVASSGASGPPDNTTQPVFLIGGSEGTTTFQQWQDALNLLKQVRVNTIVPLTGDPAVHAAAVAHCAFMGGIGRSERDCILGALNTALDNVPTKTEYKDQAVDLNTRHARLWGQAIERFNTAGVRQEFQPPFGAAVLAGMQAGSPLGTPLTQKFLNVLSVRSDASWNPVDDGEELIQAGLCFAEDVDGVGRRVVRNVTTHLQDNNIAFTEGSVNEAVNFATFNFRTEMEANVGRPGFAGTVNAAKGIAVGTLSLLVDTGVLVVHRSLDIELIVDVLEVSVEIAPVLPVNFVRSVIHLVTIRQAA